MKKVILRYLPFLICVPFIIGCIGYCKSGANINDAMYASFALFFTNPISDAYNYWIEIARWTAPLFVVTAIVCAIKTFFNNIVWCIDCKAKDSVAIYNDSNIKISFGKTTKAFYPSKEFKHVAKTHMILFDNDIENISFYEENKTWLQKGKVYIGIRDIDYGLLKNEENVYFFDINGSISRLLWKRISIWKNNKNEHQIVIIGDSALARNVLNYGLLMNLYAKEQSITYHFISNNNYYQLKHPEISSMTGNGDLIKYHCMTDSDIGDIIKQADITIVADLMAADIIQTICVNAKNNKLYYYSPQSKDMMDYLSIGNMIPFGRNEEIFTDANIRQEKLLESAKELNAYYASKYNGENKWNKLSGFVKWSNISGADFHDVLKDIFKSRAGCEYQILREELSELEHIRWSRFHYLNYWEYGEPLNGKNKDEEKRIHKCLRPYKELQEDDKNKDRNVVDFIHKKIYGVLDIQLQ